MRRSSLAVLTVLVCGSPTAAQVTSGDTHPTLAEARTSPRCDGTLRAAKIAELRAADPERDADQRIATGDFAIKGAYRRLREDGTDQAPSPSPIIVYTQPRSGFRISNIAYALSYGDVTCKTYPTAWSPLPDPAVDDAAVGWCAEAVETLAAEYAERFNGRLVAHPQYPFKDICTSGRTPRGSLVDQPSADQIPQKIPDMVTAARFGLVDHVKRFIAEGSDLTRKDVFGQDALLWSVMRNYPAVFDVLIASDAGYDFCASLSAAVNHRRDPMVTTLARRCTQATTRLYLVTRAAEQQNLSTLTALLDTDPAVSLAGATEGTAALGSAVAASNIEIARFLLDQGADPNALSPSPSGARRSLLARAIALRNTPLTELLLDRGADPAAPIEVGGGKDKAPDALRFAIEEDSRGVVEALARRGADLNAAVPIKVAEARMLTDPLGREGPTRSAFAEPRTRRFADPPIFLALDPLMNSSMVELLLQLGADPNVHDGQGLTPLMVAITNSQIFGKRGGAPWIERYVPQRLIPGQEDWEHRGADAVRILLDHEARPALTDRAGLSALHHAARSDYNTEIARMLLDHGADPNARDAAGKTPLDHARQARLERLPAVLLAAGAHPGSN